MITPPFLKAGDKVAVVCPASYIKNDISSAYEILKQWGLDVQIGATVSAQFNQFAGDDILRTQDLQEALDDPNIKAIIAGRGGYGCVRIIDNLKFDKFKKHPKWIVGFSDITVLHSHIQQKFQIPTIHGQMVKSFLDASPESLISLKNALFGQNADLTYPHKEPLTRTGKTEGTLIGGNLAILHSILSSPSDMNYDGKILFIEDIGEPHYNIDRMLWTLQRAEKFNKLNGLIVGGFTDLKDSSPPFGQRFEEIIWDKVKTFDYPVAFGCPAGHITDNRALILGKNIKLTVEKNLVSLTY